MGTTLPSFGWPLEPDGAVDCLATGVTETGHVFFTGPGGYVVLYSRPSSKVVHRTSLGPTDLRSIADGALCAAGLPYRARGYDSIGRPQPRHRALKRHTRYVEEQAHREVARGIWKLMFFPYMPGITPDFEDWYVGRPRG